MVDEEAIGPFRSPKRTVSCFGSNGKTAATTQTKPGRQLSAGLCVPDSMADP